MKKLMFLSGLYRHNYILYLKGLRYNVAKRLLTHKENVSEPNVKLTELAIPDPA